MRLLRLLRLLPPIFPRRDLEYGTQQPHGLGDSPIYSPTYMMIYVHTYGFVWPSLRPHLKLPTAPSSDAGAKAGGPNSLKASCQRCTGLKQAQCKLWITLKDTDIAARRALEFTLVKWLSEAAHTSGSLKDFDNHQETAYQIKREYGMNVKKPELHCLFWRTKKARAHMQTFSATRIWNATYRHNIIEYSIESCAKRSTI